MQKYSFLDRFGFVRGAVAAELLEAVDAVSAVIEENTAATEMEMAQKLQQSSHASNWKAVENKMNQAAAPDGQLGSLGFTERHGQAGKPRERTASA